MPRVGLRDEQLLRAPGDDLDVHYQARHDIVAYQIRESVRFLQRIGETVDVRRAVLDADDHGSASRVGEGDDTVHYPVRGR